MHLLQQKVQIQFSSNKLFEFDLIDLKVCPKIGPFDIEPFSLLFKGKPSYPLFQQGTYVIRSETIGELHAFLIPKQPDKEGDILRSYLFLNH